MSTIRNIILIATAWLLASAATASASARLVSVVATDGGCVAGPNGDSVEFWEVQPGKTYEITLSQVFECSGGGTGPAIGVRANSTSAGNTDLVAALVSPGTYRFTFTVPANAVCTMPLFYCTTPGAGSSGAFVRRSDGGEFQAHLRMATFAAGCSNPATITGADCQAVPARSRTWGQVKRYYR